MKSYRKLLGFLLPHWPILIGATICMFFVALFENLSITTMIPFIDKVIADKPIVISESKWIPDFIYSAVAYINNMSRGQLLNSISLWLIAVYFFRGFAFYGKAYLMEAIGQRVVRETRNKLYAKLTSFSLKFYSVRKSGELISRIIYDTSVIKSTVAEGFADLISQSIQLGVNIVMLIVVKQAFGISNNLIICGLALMLLVVYPVIRFAKRIRKLSRLSQEKMGDINSILFETVSGITIIKSFMLEKFKFSKFQAQNMRFYRYIMSSNKRVKAVSPITEFTAVVSASVILWLGGKEVMAGTMSPGALMAFLGGILLMNKPLKKLSGVHNSNQQALSATDRITEILEQKEDLPQLPDAKDAAEISEDIVFDNVSFSYGEKKVLHDVSFDVKKGEKIAIVGLSGSGKSTILNLIPRFYDPTGGSIKLDGVDLKKLTLSSVRSQIGIVSQDNILFNGTIKENIAYGRVGNSDILFKDKMDFSDMEEEIISSAKSAQAYDFIQKMPQGLDTVIGDRGATLSGGERQRIAIARALFKNPPVLILDEATSHLDAESEQLVQEALKTLMEGRTVFVVAHRFATIKEIEKIVVLDKGKVQAIGSHDHLLKNSALYNKLYETQFSV